MSLVTLKTELRQELKLTPQLLQSMEVLQMNAQELLDYLGRIGEENPLLEQEDAALHGAYEELCRKVSWIDAAGGAVRGDAPLPERGAADRETEDAIIRSFAGDESLRYWSRDGETHSVHDTTADGVLEI